MTRYLFDGGELIIDSEGNARPGWSFTVWTDWNGGTDVTADMRAPDGVSDVTVEADSDGEVPYLRGPDGVKGPLYRDTGSDTRSVWRSAEAEAELATTVDGFVVNPPSLPAGGQSGNFLAWAGEQQGQWADPPTATGGTADWDTLLNKPATFPPSVHSHSSGQISDSTTVGRALLTSADAATARTAIGAGVPVTPFPGFGTTATTAATGNHGHAASSVTFTPGSGVTATNVQTAIEQAATMSGGAGTAAVLVWRYTAGAWPTLPTTKPTGVYLVQSVGPSYPPSVPSWVGFGTTQIPMSYSKAAVL